MRNDNNKEFKKYVASRMLKDYKKSLFWGRIFFKRKVKSHYHTQQGFCNYIDWRYPIRYTVAMLQVKQDILNYIESNKIPIETPYWFPPDKLEPRIELLTKIIKYYNKTD